jgi:hypothetical protein
MNYTLSDSSDAPPVSPAFAARGAIYPFSRMQVGQMAAFPPPNNMVKINRAAHSVGSYKGWKFAVRRQPDGSIRVWRTA